METLNFAQILPVVQSNINSEIQLTVDARQLHAALGVGRDFPAWIKGRISQYGFQENIDYIVVENVPGSIASNDAGAQTGTRENTGSLRKDYFLTLDMAKELAMVENNDTGRQVRRYFIECEKQLRAAHPKSRLEELEEMVMMEKERIAAEQKARAELEARLRAEERSNNLVKRLNGMMSEFSLPGRPLISSNDPYYSHFVTIGEVFENSIKDRSVPVGVKITLGKMLVKFVDQLRAEEGDDYPFTSPNTEHLFEPFHLRNWIRTGYPTGLGQQMIWIVGAELFTRQEEVQLFCIVHGIKVSEQFLFYNREYCANFSKLISTELCVTNGGSNHGEESRVWATLP